MHLRWRMLISGLMFLCAAGTVRAAIAPHEIVLLVNNQSTRSKEVANHFVHLRQIPARNIVYLDLPERVLEPAAQFSHADFSRYIWEPAQEILSDRDVDERVLAWIYSVDFPVRITTDPPVSITGMTFMRNRFPPDRDWIDKGAMISPLYAGPDPDGRAVAGGSFLRLREVLAEEEMPLPAMLLGFCGSRGNTVDTVIRTLKYGQASDRSSPRGTVYFVEGEDVRARMRNWQFAGAQAELEAADVRSRIIEGPPRDLPGIVGLQMGGADVRASQAGNHLPGSMAEHVTSHAAEFHLPIQTKLTDWLRAGATASAGTVTEPYSIWAKFPHARFFGHYARGHSMLESFYLSLRSPAQTLPVGEPLARPWAPRLSMTLIAMESGTLSAEASFMAAVFPEFPAGQLEYRVVVNGEPATEGSLSNSFSFDTRDLADGYHELRVLAFGRGPIAHMATDRRGITVNNQGRAVTVEPPARDSVSLHDTLIVSASASGDPERLALVHNGRVVATAETDAADLQVSAAELGAGPVSVQVRAVYVDDMEVHSKPVRITVQRAPDLPVSTGTWLRAVWDDAPPTSGSVAVKNDRLRFAPGTNDVDIVWLTEPLEGVQRIRTQLTIPGDANTHANREIAGLAFAGEDRDQYQFFVLHGRPSAWSFGDRHNHRLRHRVQRGALLLRDTTHEIEIIFNQGEARAYVQGYQMSTWQGATRDGRIGLLVANQRAEFGPVEYQLQEATVE